MWIYAPRPIGNAPPLFFWFYGSTTIYLTRPIVWGRSVFNWPWSAFWRSFRPVLPPRKRKIQNSRLFDSVNPRYAQQLLEIEMFTFCSLDIVDEKSTKASEMFLGQLYNDQKWRVKNIWLKTTLYLHFSVIRLHYQHRSPYDSGSWRNFSSFIKRSGDSIDIQTIPWTLL